MRGYFKLASLSVRTYRTGDFIPYPVSPDGSPISKLRRYNHKWLVEHYLVFRSQTIVLNKMQIAMYEMLNCR